MLDLDKVVFVTPPKKINYITRCDNPRSFRLPASITGNRRKPHRVIVSTALMMLMLGWTETTSLVAIAIISPSCEAM